MPYIPSHAIYTIYIYIYIYKYKHMAAPEKLYTKHYHSKKDQPAKVRQAVRREKGARGSAGTGCAGFKSLRRQPWPQNRQSEGLPMGPPAFPECAGQFVLQGGPSRAQIKCISLRGPPYISGLTINT